MSDWDKELAKIDKQLASISDEELLKTAQPTAPAKTATTAKALPAARTTAGPAMATPSVGAGKPWVAWAKVLVAVGAAAGLMYWPWPARCGAPLLGFTAATGGVALLGIWSAVGTWRHRLGWAHLASLLVTVWGLGLGAREVLPRVGYAIPSLERAAQWSCDGLPPVPVTLPANTLPPGQAAPTLEPGSPQNSPGAAPSGGTAAGGTTL
jgi:hypothetical protein